MKFWVVMKFWGEEITFLDMKFCITFPDRIFNSA